VTSIDHASGGHCDISFLEGHWYRLLPFEVSLSGFQQGVTKMEIPHTIGLSIGLDSVNGTGRIHGGFKQ